MATRIRLRRIGRKKQASFRIVVAGGMHARSGRVTETIGKYNPRTEPSFVEIDERRALYWLGQGAEPSGKVEALFRQMGIMKKLADGVEGEGIVSVGSVDGKTKRPAMPGASKKAAAKAEAAAAAEAAPEAVEEAAPESAPEAVAEAAPEVVAEAAPAEEARAAEEAEAEPEKQDAE